MGSPFRTGVGASQAAPLHALAKVLPAFAADDMPEEIDRAELARHSPRATSSLKALTLELEIRSSRAARGPGEV